MEETWFPRMCQQKIFESKEYVKGKYYGIFSNLSRHGQKILLRN